MRSLILTAGILLSAAVATSPATAAPRCSASGSRTVAKTSHARVFDKHKPDGFHLYGCLFRDGTRHPLGLDGEGHLRAFEFDTLHLNGRFAAGVEYSRPASSEAI